MHIEGFNPIDAAPSAIQDAEILKLRPLSFCVSFPSVLF